MNNFDGSDVNVFRIIIPVNNIEQATVFYSDVFESSGERVSEGRHYFNLGTLIIAIYDPIADGDSVERKWVLHKNHYVYFSAESLENVHEKLLKSICRHVDQKINTMPWGERLFYAIDPFGNPICFVDETTVFTGNSH